jgi:hypothetical protein
VQKVLSCDNCLPTKRPMRPDAFQGLSPPMYVVASNKIRHNGITKECSMLCNTFGYIQQTVDSVDGQTVEIRHFSISMYCFIISGTSSRNGTQVAACIYLKQNHDSSPVIIWSKSFRLWPVRTSSSSEESATHSVFWLSSGVCITEQKLIFLNNNTSCNICKSGTLVNVLQNVQGFIGCPTGH